MEEKEQEANQERGGEMWRQIQCEGEENQNTSMMAGNKKSKKFLPKAYNEALQNLIQGMHLLLRAGGSL